MLTFERGSPRLRMWHLLALVAVVLFAIVAWNPGGQTESNTIRGPDWALPLDVTTAVVSDLSADVEKQIVAPAADNFGDIATTTPSALGSSLGALGNDVAALPAATQIALGLIAVVGLYYVYKRCVGATTDAGRIGGAAVRHSLKALGTAAIGLGILLVAALGVVSNATTATLTTVATWVRTAPASRCGR